MVNIKKTGIVNTIYSTIVNINISISIYILKCIIEIDIETYSAVYQY